MNEIQVQFLTGQNLYSIIRNSSSNIFNGNATFVSFNAPDWNVYANSNKLTEQDDSGFYQANFPTIITTPDTYTIEVFSGSGTISDNFVGGGTIIWNGTGSIGNLTGSNLTSLELVKSLLNINVSTYDSILLNFITIASTAIQNWTQQNIIYNNYNENYDGPSSYTLLLNQIPVIAIGNITLYQYDLTPYVIPGNATIINNKIGTVSITPSSNYCNYFGFDDCGQQSINVTYTAGFVNIPADIQYGCARIVQDMFVNIGADLTKLNESLPRYSYTARGDANTLISSGIRQTLSHYRDVGAI